MARITREQIQKINNNCKNEWKLDVEYYLFHSEKQLYKRINLDEENYLQFDLLYNWKNEKTLHISKYHHKDNDYFAVSNGLGKFIKLSDAEKRKSVNELIKMTVELTDEKLLQINSENEVFKSPLLVASEEF